MNTRKGFTVVEAFVIVGVIILIAGLAFVAWKSFMQDDEQGVTSVSTSGTAEVITTEEDLAEAERQLDSLDIEDSSSQEAENQANF